MMTIDFVLDAKAARMACLIRAWIFTQALKRSFK
jgi:hypothetical protein